MTTIDFCQHPLRWLCPHAKYDNLTSGNSPLRTNVLLVPSNLFLNKIGKPALYLPTAMVIWGVISGATGACQSYGGLVATRFFLGFVEAAYFVWVPSTPPQVSH